MSACLAVSAFCFCLLPGSCHRDSGLTLLLDASALPADGFSSVNAAARTTSGREVTAELRIVEGSRFVRIEGTRVFSTVLPGKAIVQASAKGYRPAQSVLETTPVWSDRAGDGTPDFLRLDDPGDRRAFSDAFTDIAEQLYFRQSDGLPPEVTDCSSLIRYAYREAFRDGLSGSARPQPAKYRFPYTPLGALIFRVASGPLGSGDLARGAFAEFADAEALRRWNTHYRGREVHAAEPGDLLFYRQPDQRSPFHAMIFIGRSQVDLHVDPKADPGRGSAYLVYHTGPFGGTPGEIRRVPVEELLKHPEPRWRPLAGNARFVGVYRWNILRQ